MTILDDVRRLVSRVADSVYTGAVTDGAVWNPWSGGSGGSKVNATRPGLPTWLSADEIDWLTTTDGLCRRVVYGPVEDALGRGWRVDSGDDRDVTQEFDANLDVEGVMAAAWQSARQYGGAFIWMVTDDSAPLAQPLPPGPHKITALHVIDQREAKSYAVNDDPKSPGFARPSVWDIQLRRDDVVASVGLVHESRLIYVPGLPLARSQNSPPSRNHYDLSVPQAYWEALRDLLLEHGASAGLVVEKSMPWVRLVNRRAADAGSGRGDFRSAIQTWSRVRSSWGVTVLGENDEVGRLDASLSGVREVVLAGYERVSAIEGIPLSALIGQPPAGLSTDDAAGQRTYARFIGRGRRLIADRALLRLYDVGIGPDPAREIVWPPVDPPTAAEVADVNNKRADTVLKLTQAQVQNPEEARTQWMGAEVMEAPTFDEDGDIGFDLPEIPEPPGTMEREEVVDDPEDDEPIADAETYAVPTAARNNARRALRWRSEHGDEVEGMTDVGWARARQLAEGGRVSREAVSAMASFNRHRGNYDAARAKDSDKPWTEPAIVAWLGWGGTTGIDWAREITGATED